MTVATTSLEDLMLIVTDEIRIDASLADSFTALLEQMGPHNEGPDGTAMPMTLEARRAVDRRRFAGPYDGPVPSIPAQGGPWLAPCVGVLFGSGQHHPTGKERVDEMDDCPNRCDGTQKVAITNQGGSCAKYHIDAVASPRVHPRGCHGVYHACRRARFSTERRCAS